MQITARLISPSSDDTHWLRLRHGASRIRTRLDSIREAYEQMTYREPLPEGCPPDEAKEIAARRIVFRLVRRNPPSDADFRSQRAEKPKNQFNVPECQARGLSVFGDLSDAIRQQKLPHFRGSKVCEVTLGSGAGRIQKTGRRSHFTWWPLADFNILAVCQLVDS